MTAAMREFRRGSAMINRAKDHGRAHPRATQADTLSALREPVTKDNVMYVRVGLH